MAQPKKKVRRELILCVEELRSLGSRSSKKHIDDVLDDAGFHLKELKGAQRCDPNKIEALENLMRRGISLLEEHENAE
jgi:hypothetical protein